MKELYEAPTVEITLFEEDDIITTSKPIELPVIPISSPW